MPATLGSLLWLLKVIYSRTLAKAKFEVIAEIERKWTLRPFEKEWSSVKGGRGWVMRVGLTWLEMAIPLGLALVGIAYLVARLLALFSGSP